MYGLRGKSVAIVEEEAHGWNSDWTNDDFKGEEYNSEDEGENVMEFDVSLEDENIRDNIEDCYVTYDENGDGTISLNDKMY